MTPAEITAYVMGLSAEDLRLLSAEDIVGAGYVHLQHSNEPFYAMPDGTYLRVCDWRPDEDRNQSRMVTDKVMEIIGLHRFRQIIRDLEVVHDFPSLWWDVRPITETRAALIAHMIHKEDAE